jgi:hypothetical protein
VLSEKFSPKKLLKRTNNSWFSPLSLILINYNFPLNAALIFKPEFTVSRFFVVVFIILVQSCASAPPIDQFTAEQIANLTKVTNTEFDAYIKITGVDIGNTVSRGLTLDVEKYYMRSNIGKNSDIESHQLYFEVKYSANDWRFYNGVSFTGGITKATTEISQEVIYCSGNIFGSCDYKEIVGVGFSYSDLLLGSKRGINLRLNTKYTNLFNYVYLPPNYFQGYLLVLNKYLNK